METMATTSANSKGSPGWLVLVCCSHPTLPTLPPSPTLQQRTSTDHWSRGTPDVDMTAGTSAPVPRQWGLGRGRRGGCVPCTPQAGHQHPRLDSIYSVLWVRGMECISTPYIRHTLCFAHVYLVSLYTWYHCTLFVLLLGTLHPC